MCSAGTTETIGEDLLHETYTRGDNRQEFRHADGNEYCKDAFSADDAAVSDARTIHGLLWQCGVCQVGYDLYAVGSGFRVRTCLLYTSDAADE